MPRRDGRGPMGQGPATGRGLGPCGYARVSPRRRYSNRGLGFRRRPGFGPFGPGFCGYLDESKDRELLEEKRNLLREELAALEEYLED